MNTLIKPPCCNGNESKPLAPEILNDIKACEKHTIEQAPVYLFVHHYSGSLSLGCRKPEWIKVKVLKHARKYEARLAFASYCVEQESCGCDDQHSCIMLRIQPSDAMTKLLNALEPLLDTNNEADVDYDSSTVLTVDTFIQLLNSTVYTTMCNVDLTISDISDVFPIAWSVNEHTNTFTLFRPYTDDWEWDEDDANCEKYYGPIDKAKALLEECLKNVGKTMTMAMPYKSFESIYDEICDNDTASTVDTSVGTLTTLKSNDSTLLKYMGLIKYASQR